MAGDIGPGLAVLAPLGAALCYGAASVLQQIGAHRTAAPRALGVRLLVDLARQPLFLLGLGLDAAGFFLAFVGLRHLPVFVVQAAVSSTVAVTAVLGSRYLADRLRRREWALVGAVVFSLFLVGSSAADGDRPPLGWLGTTLLVAGVPALALAARLVERRAPAAASAGAAASSAGDHSSSVVLGAVAGIGFGGFALAGRLLPAHDGAAGLFTDPILWAALAYALLGLSIYGAALQRGSVTAVTATTIAAEAVFPSVVGLDRKSVV